MKKLTKKTAATAQATLYATEARKPVMTISPWEQAQIARAAAAVDSWMSNENSDGDCDFVLTDCVESREAEISGWINTFRYSKAYYPDASVNFYNKKGYYICSRVVK